MIVRTPRTTYPICGFDLLKDVYQVFLVSVRQMHRGRYFSSVEKFLNFILERNQISGGQIQIHRRTTLKKPTHKNNTRTTISIPVRTLTRYVRTSTRYVTSTDFL